MQTISLTTLAQRASRLLPFSLLAVISLALSAEAFAGGHAKRSKDIVETAVSAGSFDTLVAAIQAADLVDALKAEGPYTVFAPTDEAFAKLPEDVLADLLKPENQDNLQAILLYHVVSGKIMSGDISGSAQPETLQGATIDVEATGKGVTVNNANVVAADVEASNGVIHVIDTVILPPASMAAR